MSTPIVLPSLLEIIHVAGVVEKDARDAAAAAGVGLRLMTSGASRRRESDFRDDEASTAAAAAAAACCRRCCGSRVPVRRGDNPAHSSLLRCEMRRSQIVAAAAASLVYSKENKCDENLYLLSDIAAAADHANVKSLRTVSAAVTE